MVQEAVVAGVLVSLEELDCNDLDWYQLQWQQVSRVENQWVVEQRSNLRGGQIDLITISTFKQE